MDKKKAPDIGKMEKKNKNRSRNKKKCFYRTTYFNLKIML